MASLGEVGGCLNRVLNKAAEAGVVLRTAAELAEEAQDVLKSAAEGSLQADVDTVNAQFDEAVKGIARLRRYLGLGVDGAARILHRLELDGSTPVSAGAAQTAAPPEPTSAQPPQRGSLEHIDRLRRSLPPPVQPRSGQKTHGRWFTDIDAPDAPARESMSGHDEWWEAAEQYLLDIGVPGAPVTAADVEIKIAVHMARAAASSTRRSSWTTCPARGDSDVTRWFRSCFPRAAALPSTESRLTAGS